MEFLVLNSYLKRKKNNKTAWWRIILAKGKLNFMLLIFMVLSGVISVYLLFQDPVENLKLAIIFMLIEIFLLSCLFSRAASMDIVSSEKNIREKFLYYKDIRRWLSDIHYKSKPQIKQLYYRIKGVLKKNRETRLKTRDTINKIMSLFIAPLFAYIIGTVMNADGLFDEKIIISLSLSFVWIVVYVLIFGVLEFFQPFFNKDFENMELLLRDIQGVLDYVEELNLSDVMEEGYCDY